MLQMFLIEKEKLKWVILIKILTIKSVKNIPIVIIHNERAITCSQKITINQAVGSLAF